MFEVVLINTWHVMFTGTEVECRDWLVDVTTEDEFMIVERHDGDDVWMDPVDDVCTNPFS